MKQKKLKLSVLFLGLVLTAQAQQAATTTGGNASGSGGTVAYSIGLVVYATHTGASGSVAQGVQHPYEISIVSGLENQPFNIDLQAYPNPTTDHLYLQVYGEAMKDLAYYLFDLSGKLIESKKITGPTETLRLEHLPSATYFLKVANNHKELKSFKIIKY